MLLGDSISNWGLKGGSSDDNLLFEGIDDWGVTYTLKHLSCDLNTEIKKGGLVERQSSISVGRIFANFIYKLTNIPTYVPFWYIKTWATLSDIWNRMFGHKTNKYSIKNELDIM